MQRQVQNQNQNQTQKLNTTLDKYIKRIQRGSSKTASDYKKRLDIFRDFVLEKHGLSLDELIMTLTHHSHGPKIDVYDLLSDFVEYIQNKRNVSPLTLKLIISTARSYLEYSDVVILPRKFKLNVGMPRIIRANKEALQKNDIQTILNACHNIKLKAYVLFLAATGCRASEAASIRLCDVNFDQDPTTVFIRGEYTKTKEDRVIMMTQELTQQLKQWIDYKFRTRTITYNDKICDKTYVVKRTPKINNEILLFSTKYNPDVIVTVHGLYNNMLLRFEDTLDRLGGKYAAFETSKKRRKFTLHSFRRWVKTTISDLGHHEFSEYYIGHKGSTYYRVSESEKIKLFKKIEPYLTFLDQSSLERKGADLQTKLEERDKEIADIRSRFDIMQSQIQSLLLSLGSIKDQNQLNQFAKTLYNSKILEKEH
jgi:integrase